MSSLIIVKPLLPVAFDNPYPARLFTPDPKEAVALAPGFNNFMLDMGAAVTVDSFFLGYAYGATAASSVDFWTSPALDYNANVGIGTYPFTRFGLASPDQYFWRLAAPVTSRYFRVRVQNGDAGNIVIGAMCMGLAFQTAWGQEFGAGRLIEDTGTAERLFGGGFGIDEGVATTGYQWTFGDLQPAELRALFQLVKDRRTTRSVLVVEDPDQTDGLNERIHWGLFRKLEPYERIDPLNTKWALTIGDWA